nr:immunoglobulin heavy chain junction region [Mus musculus]
CARSPLWYFDVW